MLWRDGKIRSALTVTVPGIAVSDGELNIRFEAQRMQPILSGLVVRKPGASDRGELAWSDEFDTDGAPDPANWTYEHGFVRNRELQWYQRENAFLEDGLLVIEGRRERRRNPNYDASSGDWRLHRKRAGYTSSLVTTRGLHSWFYGRFEVRARISTDEGLWPAIWFLGVEGHWPGNGEIDLMEYYAGDILANFAWGRPARSGGKPVWDAVRTPLESLGDGWQDEFHVWRMDWSESSIELYVDDRSDNLYYLADVVSHGSFIFKVSGAPATFMASPRPYWSR